MIHAFKFHFVVLFGLTVFQPGAHGDLTLFEHSGDTDPTTEGWSIGGSGSIGVSVGALPNDAGSGFDAWFVNDTSSVGGSNQSYYQLLSPGESTQAGTLGWSMSTTIRVPNSSETAGGSPFLLYRDGSTGWNVFFGSQADGDPMVLLWDGGGSFPSYTGPSYTLEGAGSTYHNYQLVFDPVTSSADLLVDGVERISDYTGRGYPTSEPTFGWGVASSPDTGQGNFNSVQFQILPEPSTLTLLLAAAVILPLRRRLRATC